MKESDETLNNEAAEEYEAPTVRVLDEAEVLAAIQINATGTSWWVM
ncbi:MAG: hypothetical protein KY459_08975 [Acidobacteria bacterium]|nr:hypothetical protein [Acidobacteriota bacterium]